MSEPAIYTIKVGLAKVVITATDDRFTSKGPMSNCDFPLADLQHFCLVPVQTYGYDAQLVVSWMEGGKLRNKKLSVLSADDSFRQFLRALDEKRPGTSLVDMEAGAALKQMGVSSLVNTANKMEAFTEKAKKWTLIIVGGFMLLVFLAIGIFWIISKFH